MLQCVVRTDSSQLVMFDAAELDGANSVSKVCRTNITGLLSPDLLYVYVSVMHRIFCSLFYFTEIVHVRQEHW